MKQYTITTNDIKLTYGIIIIYGNLNESQYPFEMVLIMSSKKGLK